MICRAGWLPRFATGHPGIRAMSLAIAAAGLAATTVVASGHHDCADLVAGAFVHQHMLDLEATAAGVLQGRLVIVGDTGWALEPGRVWPGTSDLS